MSDYRDDEVSSAIATETYTAGWGERIQEVATAAASIFLVTTLLMSDVATVTDDMTQHTVISSFDTATASDSLTGTYALKQQVTETGHGGDALLVSNSTRLSDTATAADATTAVLGGRVSDTVTVTETLTDTIHSARQISDTATATDSFVTLRKDTLSDSAAASELYTLNSSFVHKLFDAAMASDVIQQGTATDARVFDTATVSDGIQQHLAAVQHVTDAAYAGDGLSRTAGGAWTGNVAAFAMSRYANYDFTSIAVIRGVPYGTRADGVYRLDGVGSSEVIPTIAQFASMDLSGTFLGVPRYVYLGYASDSEVTLDVTTEQSGEGKDFSYTLPAEPAESGTTGRFTLGRGLRGKYFTMKLSSTGTKFRAIEMRAPIESTKRRV